MLFYVCNKMEPLSTNRRCLIWLCIHPADESASRRQKIAHSLFAMMVLVSLSCGCAASAAFCWNSVSIDLGRAFFSFMCVTTEFSMIYMALVGIFLMRHKIGTIFENLSKIYKASKWFFLSKFWKPKIMIHEIPPIFHDACINTKSMWSTTMNLDENADSFRFLARANNMSEWMWKNYFKCIAAVLIINQVVAPSISILYCWLINENLDSRNFFHPIPSV